MQKAAPENLAARPRTICGSITGLMSPKPTSRISDIAALRHHSDGIFLCERIFGVAITNSEGKQVPVRYIGEQHVREDLGRIPTAQDWLSEIKPARWMNGQRFNDSGGGTCQ